MREHVKSRRPLHWEHDLELQRSVEDRVVHMLRSGATGLETAREMGVSEKTVYRIKRRRL